MGLSTGLLLCDSLDEPHRRVAGDFEDLFAALFTEEPIDLHPYRVHEGELPADPTDHQAWLISGSRYSVYEKRRWISQLERFSGLVIESGVPIVGICFGHQLLAQVLGAPVARADAWSIGAIGYEGQLLDGGRARMLASHQDQVLELPPGARLLASAANCPIAAFSAGTTVLAIQAHPEFVPELARSLYLARSERIGRTQVQEAIGTLDDDLDNAAVAARIAEFVGSCVVPNR